MTGMVIDASVALSWVYTDQATPQTEKLLTDVENGVPIVVPVLWFTEVANGLLILQRRKKLIAKDRITALQKLESLNILSDEESGRAAFSAGSRHAEKHGLTVYDATYLEVALRRALPLATRDIALQKAARAAGIEVLS